MAKSITKKSNRKISKEEEPGKNTVTLDGNLTIENIAEIKSSIKNILEKFDEIKIDHDKAEEYDLSYLQLLCSAIKTAEKTGKKIFIYDNEEFSKLIKESGFSSTSYFSNNMNPKLAEPKTGEVR